MSLKFKKESSYLMPVFFGPNSMQQRPGGHMADPYFPGSHYAPGDNHVINVTFETDREKLESMIPDCYTLNDPYIMVSVVEFTNLGWLAGHTYNLVNVTCPVHFDGERDHLDGDLVLVMYENQADPIVGGRETMGYSKIFCEIPPIAHYFTEKKDVYRATASEWDFTFMKMEIDIKAECPDKDAIVKMAARSEGKVHYKYIPDVLEKEEIGKVPNFSKPAVACPTILPKWSKPKDYPFPIRTPEVTFCNGTVKFEEPTWEEMPTWYNVAKGLSDLPVKRVLGAQKIRYDEPCEYCTCYKLR